MANKTEGSMTANLMILGPIVENPGTMNLKNGIHKKPVIMDAMAPLSVRSFQKIDSIITGQNVAAMPDQPKITNQNTVLVGDRTETASATPNAKTARVRVTFFESPISFF